MDSPELIDLSLLIFADLGVKGTRMQQRINTLTSNEHGGNFDNPPACLKALENAGLVEIRATHGRIHYKVEITDNGRVLHRCLMAALKNAKPLIERASPPYDPTAANKDELRAAFLAQQQ